MTRSGTSAIQRDLDRLLTLRNVKLSEAQLRRLRWLAARYGHVRVPDARERPGPDGVVLVLDPISGAGAELFYRSLQPECVVVAPYSENPAFDFLKSKLTDYGTVGPGGAEGPHEMWWGGVGWGSLEARLPRAAVPRVISCYPEQLGPDHAGKLRHSLARLGIAGDIEPIASAAGNRLQCREKVEFIQKKFRSIGGPLLFVDAEAELLQPPLLPVRLDCDLALHRWNRWEMSAHTAYFGSTPGAEAVLQAWHQLSTMYPDVWDGYLLDQAWTMTSSQMSLDTIWLPRSYHLPRDEQSSHRAAVVRHRVAASAGALGPDQLFGSAHRVARRASRSGSRDSLLVLQSEQQQDGAITVLVRDAKSNSVGAVAATIEAVVRAFVADNGGFGQMELVLCSWREDVVAATHAAASAENEILCVSPGERLTSDLFRNLARPTGPRGNIIRLPASRSPSHAAPHP